MAHKRCNGLLENVSSFDSGVCHVNRIRGLLLTEKGVLWATQK